MKIIFTLLQCLLISMTIPAGYVHAEDTASAMQRIGKEVAELHLGFGEYELGQVLTDEQKEMAQKNRILKTVAGTIKFKDDDIYVIAKSDNLMVLGIYKMYEEASRQHVKSIVGDLMLRFNEPTTMAHDKLIYWAYKKTGLMAQDEFQFAKQSGDTDIIATVKLSSTTSIFPDPSPEEKQQKEAEQSEKSDIYVMITSNPLSKIFLAQNK
jgi:hypothetical protein